MGIRKYIIGCIDSECYDVECTTKKEKLQFLFDTFKKEYVYEDNLKRYGTLQNCFKEWIAGLPSCFNIEFSNWDILERYKTWGLEANTCKKEDQQIENWFKNIAHTTFSLFQANGIARLNS